MRRLLWLLIPVSFLFVVITAMLLHPDAKGIGTHQALGLPECFFHRLTGKICPSCGLTTSFTYLVHLNLIQSFKSHPLGPLLFIMYALTATFSLLEFFGNSTPLRSLLNGRHTQWIYGGVIIYLATWVGRLAWSWGT
jgi:uncharacterized protein DUF2752